MIGGDSNVKMVRKKTETKKNTGKKTTTMGLNSKTKTTLRVRVQHNFFAISLPVFCTTTT